ncbi:PA2778 family cysteine peptidase [Marinobacter apostichopi]|uniref:PA2778 family cysteine peptidase n=1 Tax=Marinobacter apostichopi TaxID=3035454 RepID=UPI0025732BDF|nr:PA2778 family cysteine peptidase [Marinobacter sp. LA51]
MLFLFPPKPASRLISLLLILLLAGCSTTPKWPATNDSSTALQTRTVLNDVPFYPQELYQCGPAALAMMLNSQGLNTNPDILRDLVYIPGREGSLQVEMVAGARSHNMLVYTLDGELESLLREVEAGNPVLVMQNLFYNWWPQWHFAVVMGFDPEKQTIILHTGTRERHEVSVKVFANTWARSDNWAAVILPPDQIPATATALKYLSAANDLETTGRTNAAITAYRTAEHRWQDQPAAILGQGNIAYTRQHVQQARKHFDRLVTKFPNEAVGWNNLAHTLGELGCNKEAAKAQQCAAALAPKRFNSQVELGSDTGQAMHCSVPACPAPPQTQD